MIFLEKIMKMFYAIVVVSFVFGSVSGHFDFDNSTGRYVHDRSNRGRFVTFNTNEHGEIEVELEFGVPFIHVPIKKSLDFAKGSIANINIGAIVLAGTMVIVSVFIIPGIIGLVSNKFMGIFGEVQRETNHHRRLYETSDFFWKFFENFDRTLYENNQIDISNCLNMMTCFTVKNSMKKLQIGNGASIDNIVFGLATNDLLRYYVIKGTIIENAIDNGLKNSDCFEKYEKCKITKKTIELLIKQFVTKIEG